MSGIFCAHALATQHSVSIVPTNVTNSALYRSQMTERTRYVSIGLQRTDLVYVAVEISLNSLQEHTITLQSTICVAISSPQTELRIRMASN